MSGDPFDFHFDHDPSYDAAAAFYLEQQRQEDERRQREEEERRREDDERHQRMIDDIARPLDDPFGFSGTPPIDDPHGIHKAFGDTASTSHASGAEEELQRLISELELHKPPSADPKSHVDSLLERLGEARPSKPKDSLFEQMSGIYAGAFGNTEFPKTEDPSDAYFRKMTESLEANREKPWTDKDNTEKPKGPPGTGK